MQDSSDTGDENCPDESRRPPGPRTGGAVFTLRRVRALARQPRAGRPCQGWGTCFELALQPQPFHSGALGLCGALGPWRAVWIPSLCPLGSPSGGWSSCLAGPCCTHQRVFRSRAEPLPERSGRPSSRARGHANQPSGCFHGPCASVLPGSEVRWPGSGGVRGRAAWLWPACRDNQRVELPAGVSVPWSRQADRPCRLVFTAPFAGPSQGWRS